MIDDLADPVARLVWMQKRLERTGVVAGTDNPHSGTGAYSVLLGPFGDASGDSTVALGESASASGNFGSVAIGNSSEASAQSAIALGFGADASNVATIAVGVAADAAGVHSIAVGWNANAAHDNSVAIGPTATTTGSDQIMLGASYHTVVVPGTFSNPSARRLKKNIIPAPNLRDIFPELVEYEYIDADGRRRLGYIADDLVGTDAERFVVFDDDGRPSGIDYLTLLIAQNAQLHARLTALENK